MRHNRYELAAWVGFSLLIGGAYELFGGGWAAIAAGGLVLVVAVLGIRNRGGN